MKRSDSPRDEHDFPPPSRIVRPGDMTPLWAAVRRRWTVAALMLFAFALVVIFGTPIAPRFVKPGNLSTPHAQILESDLVGGGCTICHDNVSARTWSEMRDSGHALSLGETMTMTQRCVACHHDRIPADRATSAHNLSDETRVAIGEKRQQIRLASAEASENIGAKTAQNPSARFWLPSVAISQDEVACSVCHREHHGADADLKSIADARCQTCHQQKFGSFADSHPEFRDWPVPRPSAIVFDHAKHALVHFPKAAEAAGTQVESGVGLDCRSCHSTRGTSHSSPLALLPGDSMGDPIVSTLPFEVACASCHDETLKVQIASGPALIELPILPLEVARQVASWPVEATGPADGKLSAWMLLLLRDQEPTVDFTPLADLARVDWQLPKNQQLAVRLAEAIRRFAIELSLDGQAFLQRAARQAGADAATASRLASSFPTQLMSDAVRQWFGDDPTGSVTDRFSPRRPGRLVSEKRSSGGGDGLLDGLSDDEESDLLMDWSQPKTDETPPRPENWESELKRRFDAARSQSLGGWYRDDLTLSIRYRGSGHQDVVLRCLIELASTADPVLRENVVSHPAVAACISCHAELPWRTSASTDTRGRLTRFSHRPHLDITVLQNCEHCHTMRDPTSGDAPSISVVASAEDRQESGARRLERLLSLVDRVPARPERAAHASDFLPLTKADCAHCHTRSAAGDSCTTCHRYHVGDVQEARPAAVSIQPIR